MNKELMEEALGNALEELNIPITSEQLKQLAEDICGWVDMDHEVSMYGQPSGRDLYDNEVKALKKVYEDKIEELKRREDVYCKHIGDQYNVDPRQVGIEYGKINIWPWN